MKTWGELRTLNSEKLGEEMIKEGKGNRIHFKKSSCSEVVWVLANEEDFMDINNIKKENEILKRRLAMVIELASF